MFKKKGEKLNLHDSVMELILETLRVIRTKGWTANIVIDERGALVKDKSSITIFHPRDLYEAMELTCSALYPMYGIAQSETCRNPFEGIRLIEEYEDRLDQVIKINGRYYKLIKPGRGDE